MNKLSKLLALSLSVVVLAGCGPTGSDAKVVGKDHLYAEYFEGKEFKDNFNAYAATTINKELNYMKLSDGAVAKHWANFVDGLLLQNEYGVLEKQLAVSAKQENDFQKFTFEVKKNVPWVNWKGEQYQAMIDGKAVPQFVSAEDFVTSAREVLKFQNGSQTYYLLTNFIEGAMEYYQCTYLDHMVQTGGAKWAQYGKSEVKFAKKLTELIEEATGKPLAEPITKDMLPAIRTFKRVGVKVVEDPTTAGGGKVQYTLDHSAFYFPTLLTYSCYLPVNKHFLKQVKFPSFGKDKEKILFCGPFLLNDSNDVKITYKKNESYWKAEEVFVNTINYRIAGSLDSDADTARMDFESGLIDGFGINSQDTEGWIKYITGPDGTGTIENPHSPLVNSRDYDNIDFVYGMHLNLERLNNNYDGDDQSYATKPAAENRDGNPEQIANTQKAFRLQAVRDLILKSLDIAEYSKRYSLNVDDEELAGQYSIHTYVPKGFVNDNEGNDYTTTHYYNAYAEWYKESTGEAITHEQVATKLQQGQYKNVNKSIDELAPYREAAIKAVELYNKTCVNWPAEDEDGNKIDNTPITWPIQMEMFSHWTMEEMNQYDSPLILGMNRRLNNMPTVKDFDRTTKDIKFLVIPTYDINTQNAETVSNAGNFDISTQWGWGPDYGDPMSYMHTFVKNGDWNNVFRYLNNKTIDNYNLSTDGKSLVKTDLLAEYTDLVREADSEVESISVRYQKFAQAECMLLNELAIYQPLTMTGQGRNVSISRAAAYLNPTGSYGLAKDRNDGLIVLKEAISGNDRKRCKDLYDSKKAAYIAEHSTVNIY